MEETAAIPIEKVLAQTAAMLKGIRMPGSMTVEEVAVVIAPIMQAVQNIDACVDAILEEQIRNKEKAEKSAPAVTEADLP